MHHTYIQRCIKLAEAGRGHVSPNPLVGCFIMKDGEVIAEGAHEEFGGKHAELIALEKAGEKAKGATLYVNIEPCCKQGKQPPCTDAIIAAGIKTVVFGARDPSNSGQSYLNKKSVKVIGPILEPECTRQNKGFFSLIESGRPFVTMKKAMRKNGSIDGKITSEEQDTWSHTRLRATHDAILVGAGTVIEDNPHLTNRSGVVAQHAAPLQGLQPRRIILDPNNDVPADAAVLTDSDASRTLLIHEKLPIPELLEKLKNEGIASVLVEGGPTVWKSFEESGCVDEEVILMG